MESLIDSINLNRENKYYLINLKTNSKLIALNASMNIFFKNKHSINEFLVMLILNFDLQSNYINDNLPLKRKYYSYNAKRCVKRQLLDYLIDQLEIESLLKKIDEVIECSCFISKYFESFKVLYFNLSHKQTLKDIFIKNEKNILFLLWPDNYKSCFLLHSNKNLNDNFEFIFDSIESAKDEWKSFFTKKTEEKILYLKDIFKSLKGNDFGSDYSELLNSFLKIKQLRIEEPKIFTYDIPTTVKKEIINKIINKIDLETVKFKDISGKFTTFSDLSGKYELKHFKFTDQLNFINHLFPITLENIYDSKIYFKNDQDFNDYWRCYKSFLETFNFDSEHITKVITIIRRLCIDNSFLCPQVNILFIHRDRVNVSWLSIPPIIISLNTDIINIYKVYYVIYEDEFGSFYYLDTKENEFSNFALSLIWNKDIDIDRHQNEGELDRNKMFPKPHRPLVHIDMDDEESLIVDKV